ncbi:MAG: hypothetical protein ACTHU0_36110 [Kofleriaceae bacterium]
MNRRWLAIAAWVACAACGSFEDKDIVLDTRILAMAASVPDQVIDIDLENPPQPAELLAQMVPTEMCGLVADPEVERRLRWRMVLCVLNRDERCDSVAAVRIGGGTIEDPDTAVPAPRMCATIEPDGNLLGVVLEALESDSFGGLGGIDYGVQLIVGPEDGDPADDLYAGKTLRVAPRIPAERRANQNPSVDRFEVAIAGSAPVELPLGRCVDQAAPVELPAGQEMRITPIETAGAREDYVVPTLDGQWQMFSESLTYQWMASAGGYSSGSTGGPRDVSGNPAPLFTDYRAPRARDLDGPRDVALWIVQRDERLGARWYESCVRVVP